MSKSKLIRNFIFSIIMVAFCMAVIIADLVFLNSDYTILPLFSVYYILPFFGILTILFVAKAVNGTLALNKGETYFSVHKVLSKVTTALLILALILDFVFFNYYLFDYGRNYMNLSSEQDEPQLYDIFNISSFTNVIEDEKSEYWSYSSYDHTKFLKSESICLSKYISPVGDNGEPSALIHVTVEYLTNVPPIFNFIRYEMLKMSLPNRRYDENRQYVYSYILNEFVDSMRSKGTAFYLLSKENRSFLYVKIETCDPDFRIDEEKALEYFKTAGEEALRAVNPT